jgi:hypothetical protein
MQVTNTAGRSRRRWVAIALVATAAATAGAVSLPSRNHDNAIAGPPEIDQATQSLIAAFRREQTPYDVMPGNPVAALRETGDAQPGEDPSQSRRVHLPGASRPAYLWPMSAGVCHSAPSGGIGCAPTEAIQERGVALSVRSNIDPERGTYAFAKIFGIARDGIDAVTFRFSDETTRTVNVQQNLLYVRFDDMPVEFAWSDGANEHAEPMPGRLSDLELQRLNTR